MAKQTKDEGTLRGERERVSLSGRLGMVVMFLVLLRRDKWKGVTGMKGPWSDACAVCVSVCLCLWTVF